MKRMLPLLVLLPFTAWSSLIIFEHGYFGFITVALHEPWAMQMLLDLSISLVLVGGWMIKDARRYDINPLPFLVLLPFLGSIGALGYLVRRSLVRGDHAALA